ncbi:MAG: GGDEF domain-containing protein [Dyella sp.]
MGKSWVGHLRIWAIGLGLLLASAVQAGIDPAMYAMRSAAVTDPHGLISALRLRLTSQAKPASEPQRREQLWWLGTAAINSNDDGALTTALDRLDRLSAGDPVAAAAAGFLRSRHDIANGNGGGLGEALAAAGKVQEQANPAVQAWARFQLCDAYALDELADKALPLCRLARDSYAALGDSWGMADVENDMGIALQSQQRARDAALAFESARRRFGALDAQPLVVMVGDNLAQSYLDMGRPVEALALSRASLKQELASGRISDSVFSRADIARAYAALGRHQLAYATIQESVATARAAGLDGQLTDLLATESRMAERIGNLKQALADVREILKREASTSTPALRALQAQLEQRYAARENTLRIRDLERENRLKDLALQAAQATQAQHDEAQRREKLGAWLAWAIAFALVLILLLLMLFLRTQRRHANTLRIQALRDPLTGVDNRRAFLQRVAGLLAARPMERQRAPALLLIDFDHFKRINDSSGHPQGDRVLALVVDYLRGGTVGLGHVARLGGEEFAVLCPSLGRERALALAETLRIGVAALSLPSEVKVQGVTVSIGVAIFDGEQCHDLDSWMRCADAALYRAKGAGRNRVMEGDAIMRPAIAGPA